MINIWSVIEALDTDEQKITAEYIFNQYKNAIYHIAYDVVKNIHDAEDITMETVVKICKNIDTFTEKSDTEIKLLIIAYTRNTAIDYVRKKRRKPEQSLDANPLNAIGSDENTTDSNTYENDVSFVDDDFGKLQKYVVKLPEKYKDVLVNRYVQQMKISEIAEIMGTSESTIATWLSRARARLKKMYEKGEN